MSGELAPLGQGDLATRRPGVPPSAPGGWSPPPPRPTSDDEIDLREVWAILRRNWWIVAGCTVLGLLAAIAYVRFATPIYRSSTTLQFQEKGSTVPVLDALRDLQGGTEVGTEMEVLRSRSLAEAVIDSLGLQVLVRGPRDVRRTDAVASVQADADAPEGRVRLVRGEDGRFGAELITGEAEGELGAAAPGEAIRLPGATVVLAAEAATLDRIEVEILPRTLAAERFGEALGVSRPNRDANVVRVRFDAPDPELARDVANVLAHQYLVRRNAVRKVSDRSTVDFLRSQVDTLQGQLRSAEEAVRRFREANRVVSLEAEAEAQVQRLAALQAQRAELEAEREALAGLLAEARVGEDGAGEGSSPFRRLLAFPTLLRNQTTSTLLQQLTERETELAQLRVRRTPADPDVQAVAGQLRNLEEQAAAVVTTYLGGLANQVEAIDRELAGFGRRLAQVPAKEVEYARLERSARVLADIYTLLQTRLKEAEVVEAVEDASVRVVDVAVVARRPTSPKALALIVGGSLSSLLLGIAGGLARGFLGERVHSAEEASMVSGLPLLGKLPAPKAAVGDVGPTGASVALRPAGVPAPGALSLRAGLHPEGYATLRTNLVFAMGREAIGVLLVTSPSEGAGKSTTALHLACSFTDLGLRVLLVDADLRRRGLSRSVPGIASRGFGEVLEGRARLEEAVLPFGRDGRRAVDFLPAGWATTSPAELLASSRSLECLAEMRRQWEVVIIDSPPILPVPESSVLANCSDATLLVMRSGHTNVRAIHAALDQLRFAGARVVGLAATGVALRRYESGYGSPE